tara:strand:+ start:422 stop:544 length:123 start_codon:yes stop_codon:yes gene_type:complete
MEGTQGLITIIALLFLGLILGYVRGEENERNRIYEVKTTI